MRPKWNCLAIMTKVMFGKNQIQLQQKHIILPVKNDCGGLDLDILQMLSQP